MLLACRSSAMLGRITANTPASIPLRTSQIQKQAVMRGTDKAGFGRHLKMFAARGIATLCIGFGNCEQQLDDCARGYTPRYLGGKVNNVRVDTCEQ
jgi:hypothetical protein